MGKVRDATLDSAGTLDTEDGDLDAPPTSDGSMAALLGAVARAPSSRPPVELGAGTIVDATYRIVGPIGSGGMGVVYLARDLDLQRDVALKIHRAETGVDRLQREAIAMAQLAHPNVVTVHAVGLISGRAYVAMEFVPGQTLRTWTTSQKRGWREVLAMLLAAGDGLAAAHDAGFVHRDFKPENVLVGRDGRPRVGDFGLVRATEGGSSHDGVPRTIDDVDGDAETPGSKALAETMEPTGRLPIDSPLTRTGAALGTPAYMAPEQFAGGDVDARADQFAFCVVLHETLCGRRPFRGTTYTALRVAVCEGEPESLPRGIAPSWLSRALRRGLARNPADRWPDLHALLSALRAAPRRRSRLVTGGSITLAAAAAVGVFAMRPTDAVVPPPHCERAGAAIDRVWSPERSAALKARAAGEAAPAAEYAQRISTTFDRWAGRYRTVAEKACRAERVDRIWSARTAVQGRSCLLAALSGARILAGRLDRAGRADLPGLTTASHNLDLIEDCLDERVLMADYQVPADPAIAARVFELQRDLTEVDDTIDIDKDVPTTRARLAALRPEIERLGFAPLIADVLRLDGKIARAEKRFDDAIDRFERAYATARAAGAETIALDASRWLIWIHGVDRQELPAARQWVVQSLPEAEHYGISHVSASVVFQAAAVVAEISADYDRAIELNRKLVAAYRDVDDIAVASHLGNLGSSLDASGRSREAIEAYQEALGLYQRAYGADDPRSMWIRNNLIVAEVAIGDTAAAIADSEEALRILGSSDPDQSVQIRFNYAFALQSADRHEDAIASYLVVRKAYAASHGLDSPDVADVDANLGDLYTDTGKPTLARPYLEHALAIRIATYGENHDKTADVLTHLGGLEANTRGCAKATPYYTRAVEAYGIVAEKGGVEIGRSAGAMIGLGDCEARAGHQAAALRLYQQAHHAAAAGDADRHTRFAAAWQLGWALVEAGRAVEARSILVDARALIDDGDVDAEESRATVDAWLEKH